MPATLNCFRCGRKLRAVFPREDRAGWMPENQPHAGTTFIARGQYGSTVFDPESLSGREFLEINICDACMLEGSAQGTVLHGVTPVPLRNDYVPWQEHERLIWCEQCGRAAWRPHDRHDGEPPW